MCPGDGFWMRTGTCPFFPSPAQCLFCPTRPACATPHGRSPLRTGHQQHQVFSTRDAAGLFGLHDRWEVFHPRPFQARLRPCGFCIARPAERGTPCPFRQHGQVFHTRDGSRQRSSRTTIPCAVPRKLFRSRARNGWASDRPAFLREHIGYCPQIKRLLNAVLGHIGQSRGHRPHRRPVSMSILKSTRSGSGRSPAHVDHQGRRIQGIEWDMGREADRETAPTVVCCGQRWHGGHRVFRDGRYSSILRFGNVRGTARIDRGRARRA